MPKDNSLELEAEMLRERSRTTGLENTEPSRTKQADAHEADINTIIARYHRTGDPTIFQTRPGQYMDVSDVPDYQRCLDIVNKANTDFAALPATIRERFANNPVNLIAAIYDPARKQELTELGIFQKSEEPPKDAPPEKPPAS